MQVTKRDGTREELDISNIRKQTVDATRGLENVTWEELELKSKVFFYDGIKTTEIQQALISTASNLVSIDKPQYTYVAGRLTIYDLIHKVAKVYKAPKGIDIYKSVTFSKYIEKNKEVLSDWHTKYTKEELDILDSYIDPTRDELFTYQAVKVLINHYLIKLLGEHTELPQHQQLAIACTIFQNEPKDKRLGLIKELYDTTSLLKYIHATPINSGCRLKDSGLISCLVGSMEDNIESIFDLYKEIGIGSKRGSGWGMDVSRLRSMGSSIRHVKEASSGKVPFIKVINDVAVAVNQMSKRPGAVAVYVSVWDIDILDFLEVKKHHGDERARARDIFPAVIVDDIFMERMEADKEIVLFDPKDCPEFTETYGKEFREHYLRYEQMFLNKEKEFNPNTRVVKANDVMRAIVQSQTETGTPFIFFKDTVNEKQLHKHDGIIRSSNLCMEVVIPTDYKKTAVCNLGSINLGKFNNDLEDLANTTKIAIHALDNVIDLATYPNEHVEDWQKNKLRSIGLGAMGEAELIATKHIEYGSEEHKSLVHSIYHTISTAAKSKSKELGKDRGTWNSEYRNHQLLAIAPNSTSGLLAGTTNGIEPVFNKYWVEDNKHGSTVMTAPNITKENAKYYKNAYEIPSQLQIDMNSIRQEYIDQSISFNLYYNPEEVTGKKIREDIIYAWKKGLKTIYYVRTQPPKVTNTTNIKCIGCEN